MRFIFTVHYIDSMQLSGRNILLGITGGIAAYKCAELVRLLKKADAKVQVVMSEAASEFVTPMTLQALSGREVRSSLFDLQQESAMGHIELARWADLIMIAPATANFISELSSGAANDLLTTLVLAAEVPVVVAPAMNQAMWSNPATQSNVVKLKQRNIPCWGPASGEQACGENGAGRMLEPVELFQQLVDKLTAGPLQGRQVILTAGPTYEPIDPVRFIGNRSSGKMGFALARAFANAGASVTLVAGPVVLDTPHGVQRIDVETAEQMFQAVKQHLSGCDLFVGCAAVADYRVASVAQQKIKKQQDTMDITLEPNTDILAWVAAQDDKPFTLGFAAETQKLHEYASAKRIRKGIDVIAANLVGAGQGGFATDDNALSVIWEGGMQELPMMDKEQLARQLVLLVTDLFLKNS